MSKQRKCVGKESFERMNYLYQLANTHVNNEHNNSSSYFYSNLVVNISKKTVQKLDVTIKQSICKGCRAMLLAGVTCTVRVKKKKVIWRCLTCSTTRNYQVNPNYKLWLEQPESIVETLDYTPNETTK